MVAWRRGVEGAELGVEGRKSKEPSKAEHHFVWKDEERKGADPTAYD